MVDSEINVGNDHMVLVDGLLSTATENCAAVSPHQHRFYLLKKCLTDNIIQNAAKPKESHDSDNNNQNLRPTQDLSQFLLLMMFRCSVLDVLLLAPSLPPPSSQAGVLFQDLCDYCLELEKNYSVAREEDYASHLLTIILNEVELFSKYPNTFERFVTCVIQEGAVVAPVSRGDDGNDGGDRRHHSLCRIIKTFLSEQLDLSDSSFSLLLLSVQKSQAESADGVVMTDTIRTILQLKTCHL
jgi:hypothetical protein